MERHEVYSTKEMQVEAEHWIADAKAAVEEHIQGEDPRLTTWTSRAFNETLTGIENAADSQAGWQAVHAMQYQRLRFLEETGHDIIIEQFFALTLMGKLLGR